MVFAVVAGIDCAHDQLVVARHKRIRHIKLKGQVAALVVAQLAPVEPDRGEVVHGAKVQDDDALRSGSIVEVATIPGCAVRQPQIVKLRLPG
jgi:hypothetical protein